MTQTPQNIQDDYEINLSTIEKFRYGHLLKLMVYLSHDCIKRHYRHLLGQTHYPSSCLVRGCKNRTKCVDHRHNTKTTINTYTCLIY